MLKLAEAKLEIPIEISTISNIQEPNQIRILLDEGVNIKRICLPVSMNRSKDYLFSICCFCAEKKIEVELIANEFCYLNKANCEGLFRKSCYDMSSHAEGDDTSTKYPQEICTRLRESDPVNWLRAKWIIPEMMKMYNRFGINHFKLTGRTHPSEFLMKIIPWYMNQKSEGHLLELWPHLQTIEAANFDSTQEKTLSRLPKIPNNDQMLEFCRQVLKYCRNNCIDCRICEKQFRNIMEYSQ